VSAKERSHFLANMLARREMMPNDDPAFPGRVRTKGNNEVPLFIGTVGEALDAIHALPKATQGLPHWQRARSILYDAYDPPHDASKVKAAETAFRDALQKERWLN
jgi:hypothetical protein